MLTDVVFLSLYIKENCDNVFFRNFAGDETTRFFKGTDRTIC